MQETPVDPSVGKIPPTLVFLGFSGGSNGKESTCKVGELVSIPGLGRSPGEGNGNALQYFCLENSIDKGAWQATVHGVAKSQTRLEQLTQGIINNITGGYGVLMLIAGGCEFLRV